ncbi:MAG: hypothetical protein DLM62_18725 [Pseudonocardiales bacterium]|nr:MAG: hypothetical protein DLM62_18725 [Pseudonocardiales bacterium]
MPSVNAAAPSEANETASDTRVPPVSCDPLISVLPSGVQRGPLRPVGERGDQDQRGAAGQADAQPGGPSEHACGQRSGDLADVRDGEDLAQCLVGRAMARSDVQAGGEREAWWAVGVKRDRKPRVRCTDSRRLRVSDERRDPLDVEKLAKVLIGLAREQELNQPAAATQSVN